MITFENNKDLIRWRRALSEQRQVGFIPTMGALHQGHLSLIEKARRECDQVAVSIFVNPTQFNDPKDLEHYPRPLNEDLALLENAGVQVAFIPSAEEIYADKYRFELNEKENSSVLCGASRPGHFNGVLTVVLKLFHLVQPHRAYFGEKDFQQLQLIRDMTQALFMPIEIIAGPTVREPDGLAMSSRNRRLSPAERDIAPRLYRHLQNTTKPLDETRKDMEADGFRVDYLEDHWGRRFVAAFLGSVRLIDNVEI